jgi:RNA polymerase sigma-70 factor (ECF subfamily)
LSTEINLTDLVDTHTSALYSWAHYKVSDPELAKDLVQDTFLVAAERPEAFKGDSSPKTWLFSILNHKIMDVYRKKMRQPVRMDDRGFADFFDRDGNWKKDKRPADWHEEELHLLDNYDFQMVLTECLDALPEKWSTGVKLKYLTEKSGQEICRELGIAPTNFWQIIHRAKLQLRDCVENNWFKN